MGPVSILRSGQDIPIDTLRGVQLMPYDPEMVQPMRDDLIRLGAIEMRTAAEVNTGLNTMGRR